MVSDRPSSGTGSTVKLFGIDSQLVSHWQSNDESQVATDWSSSGIGSTVKWYHIGSQVASDWPSSGTGLTVKWFGIDSQVVSHWQSYDESQVATD